MKIYLNQRCRTLSNFCSKRTFLKLSSKTCVISVSSLSLRSSPTQHDRHQRASTLVVSSLKHVERIQRKSERSFSPWHRALYSLASQREANWTREEAYGGGMLIARSRIAVNKREAKESRERARQRRTGLKKIKNEEKKWKAVRAEANGRGEARQNRGRERALGWY